MGGPEHTGPASVARRGLAWTRRHPVVTGTFAVCIALGAVLGLVLLSGDWSPLRRLLAGSVAGASTALLITATKLFG